MRLLRALAHRQVRLLWFGQVFSAVGDEVYAIAIVFFAAKLIGLNAGYVSAVQAGSVFTFSLLGGIWADHRDHRQLMIATDLARGLTVLCLPLFAVFFPLNLWILLLVAIVISSLGAFFNPALSAFLPHLVADRPLLQACNGLMETTGRFARVIGPGLVGLLSRFIPLIHYFTIDAISFFASAWSIFLVKHESPIGRVEIPRLGLWESLLVGHRLARANSAVYYLTMSGALAGAAWIFIFPLGMALLIRDRLPMEVGALGIVVFGYGIGNISANLISASLPVRNGENWVYVGRLLAGVGFILLSQCTTLKQMMFASSLAATGGPLTDLGFLSLLQMHYRGTDIARVFRYKTMLNYGGLFPALLISPQLFRLFTVPTVILAMALVILAGGLLGLVTAKGRRQALTNLEDAETRL